MNRVEEVRFRMRAIAEGRPDGYGDPHSLRNVLDCIVRPQIRYLQPVVDEVASRGPDWPLHKDPAIVALVAEHRDLSALLVEARAFLVQHRAGRE